MLNYGINDVKFDRCTVVIVLEEMITQLYLKIWCSYKKLMKQSGNKVATTY